MTKFQRLVKRFEKLCEKSNKLGEKISEHEEAEKIRYRLEIRRETAEEIYNLMIGEFESYIDKGIAKEIAERFGVEVTE